MRTSPQPPHKEKYPTLQKHIFHFNPPLEISKEFERKYLKIHQIAFTNPLNSWKTWAPPDPSLILRLTMIMIIIKEHFWLPCHCYGCSSNEWWTVIIMRSQFWYLQWVSGECMAEMRRQEFGPNSLTKYYPMSLLLLSTRSIILAGWERGSFLVPDYSPSKS